MICVLAALVLADAPKEITITVDGVERQALIQIPADKGLHPIVFGFHGHGGNMRNAYRSFDIARYWPEAIVIYPQGLKTVTKNDPKGERPGWQNRAALNGDRDLKLFDALLNQVKKQNQGDPKRVFVMGHSNGGGFTYLLLEKRPSVITAFGPSSAFFTGGTLTPKPVFHIGGTKDPLVPFAKQQGTIDDLLLISGCETKGESWSPKCEYYKSKTAPIATYVSDVGHVFQRDAMPFMIRFFKAVAP